MFVLRCVWLQSLKRRSSNSNANGRVFCASDQTDDLLHRKTPDWNTIHSQQLIAYQDLATCCRRSSILQSKNRVIAIRPALKSQSHTCVAPCSSWRVRGCPSPGARMRWCLSVQVNFLSKNRVFVFKTCPCNRLTLLRVF